MEAEGQPYAGPDHLALAIRSESNPEGTHGVSAVYRVYGILTSRVAFSVINSGQKLSKACHAHHVCSHNQVSDMPLVLFVVLLYSFFVIFNILSY